MHFRFGGLWTRRLLQDESVTAEQLLAQQLQQDTTVMAPCALDILQILDDSFGSSELLSQIGQLVATRAQVLAMCSMRFAR